uniref:Uncharacterized protein n=1 Tax=Ditylenchus dipsaci TaxID=166011 RepID=A0A915EB94_9BILA
MSQYDSPQNSFKLKEDSTKAWAKDLIEEPFVELKLVKATDVKKQTFVSNIGDTTKILVSYLKGPDGRLAAKVDNLTPSSIKSRLTSISVNKDLSNPDYVKMVLGYNDNRKFYMYNLSMIWMEGLQSYCKKGPRNYIVYVLFDPTFLDSGTPRSLEAFIKSIYYVGSGMPGRPLDHLRDYLNRSRRQPWKLRLKIHELYPLQKYVMLPIRVNLFRQQAFLYETCIIEFLCSGGRDQLVNQNRGHQIFSRRSSGEHGHYGAYMLENYGFPRIRNLQKEDLYIGPNELFLCESVPKCVRFQMVTLSCGVTLASEEIWEFLRLNKHAFVGCHLAFGRITVVLVPKLDLLFSDVFDQCSRIVLPWPFDGPEWDGELLGYIQATYEQLFKNLAFLMCDELDFNTIYVHEIVNWIGFGILNNRPRLLFFRSDFSIMMRMLDPVHQWCLESNYNKVDFKIYYRPLFHNCSFDVVKKENSADVPRSNCPANCAQRIMEEICSYPNQYEITNFVIPNVYTIDMSFNHSIFVVLLHFLVLNCSK